jgi:hypothetical protein
MPVETLLRSEDCNCFAVRSAARHIRQLYDQFLAPIGLRTTQFSILAKLKRRGPLTINGLTKDMVIDHTTLGRNILPLERNGLIRIQLAASDRRAKELQLTKAGGEAPRGGAQGLGHGAGTIRRRVRDQARGGPARLVAGCRGKRIRAMTAKAPVVTG